MFHHHYMNSYVFVKKSSLLLAGLAAACLVGYHFYKYHRKEIKTGIEDLTDDVAEVQKGGKILFT